MWNCFIDHPKAAGETWSQHAWESIKISGKFFKGAFAACVHSCFPCLFETTASEICKEVVDSVEARKTPTVFPPEKEAELVCGDEKKTELREDEKKTEPVDEKEVEPVCGWESTEAEEWENGWGTASWMSIPQPKSPPKQEDITNLL